MNFNRNNKAQTTIEYITLVGVVAMVLFAMNPMIKRTIQSVVKLAADQIGNQKNADQSFSSETGYLEFANYKTNAVSKKRVVERPDYRHNTVFDDDTFQKSNALSTLGFTEDN